MESKLTTSLISLGYSQSKYDYSLFVKNDNYLFTCILVYVDDLLLASNNISEIQNINSYLDKTFTIKDLGHLKYFLGFEIARSSQGISLCQRKYTLDLLQEYGIMALKLVSTSMDPTNNLHDSTSKILHNPSAF